MNSRSPKWRHRVRRAVDNFERAVRADEMSGAGDPEMFDVLAARYIRSKERLLKIILDVKEWEVKDED